MAMATRLFDAVAPQLALERNNRARFRRRAPSRSCLHDLATHPSPRDRRIMPPVAAPGAGWARERGTRRAGHEDYTLNWVLDSALAAEIRRRFSSGGIEPSTLRG